MATGADLRVADAEREAVAGQLREHYAAGRLTMDEFRARLDAAYSAMTARDLSRVTADLPGATPGTGGGARPAGRTAGAGHVPRPRRRRRLARPAALLILAALLAASALALGSLPHGGLLVLAFLLVVVPVVLLTALAGTLIWVGRRAWRSGAWLELVPVAAGMPWLGRAIWLVRAALVGRAFWRLGGRARRPVRAAADRRHQRRGYPQYQPSPGGPWHQARVGDLSGTTR
jgi:hypothetical protein